MEIAIILFLILLNGVFSMSEIALVSSRKSRLETEAKRGDKKAKAALDLANSPNRFLSTVQIGITLIGILTGIYGGEKFTVILEPYIAAIPALQPYSTTIATTIIVFFITYMTLVLGELVPKRLGMAAPEAISKVVALPMNLLSRVTSPFITLLSWSSDAIIRILNLKHTDNIITEEEIKTLIQEGTTGGIFEEIEQEIVHNVFQLGDRKVTSLMTNRQEIVWLDIEDSVEENKQRIFETKHAIYPLCKGTIEEVIGLVYIKDLIGTDIDTVLGNLESIKREPLYLPETNMAYQALEKFKEQRTFFGIIVDEYGGILGIVTMHDIMDALVGDISDDENLTTEITERDNGTFLVEAQIPFDDFLTYFKISLNELEKKEFSAFNTLGGFVLHILEDIPKPGQNFTWKNFEIEVIDMDKSRIDMLLLTKLENITED